MMIIITIFMFQIEIAHPIYFDIWYIFCIEWNYRLCSDRNL